MGEQERSWADGQVDSMHGPCDCVKEAGEFGDSAAVKQEQAEADSFCGTRLEPKSLKPLKLRIVGGDDRCDASVLRGNRLQQAQSRQFTPG